MTFGKRKDNKINVFTTNTPVLFLPVASGPWSALISILILPPVYFPNASGCAILQNQIRFHAVMINLVPSQRKGPGNEVGSCIHTLIFGLNKEFERHQLDFLKTTASGIS